MSMSAIYLYYLYLNDIKNPLSDTSLLYTVNASIIQYSYNCYLKSFNNLPICTDVKNNKGILIITNFVSAIFKLDYRSGSTYSQF